MGEGVSVVEDRTDAGPLEFILLDEPFAGIDPIAVAPAPDGPTLDITAASSSDAGERSAARGRTDGNVDGVRPWREGEGATSVHWSSSLRSRSLIVHDRASSSEAP